MPSVIQILEQRQARQIKYRQDVKPRLALGLAILISLGFAIFGVLTAVAYAQVSQDLPNIEILPQYFEPPNGLLLQPTRLVDRSGKHILLLIQNPRLAPVSINAETIAQFRRTYLPIQPVSVQDTGTEYLPANIITTTLAIADPEFWEHPGFTLQGFLKTEQKTLAQQLAASLLLDTEPTGFRKAIRERLLAVQITSHFGREKILEWYLNSTAYGRYSYGIDEAARLYFEKPASQLSMAEAAVLAAVSQSPTLNPYDAPQAALERQKFVIQEMLRLRLISPEEGLQAALEKLNFSASTLPRNSLVISGLSPKLAPAFVNLAVAELDTVLQRSRLERGGFIVHTTLDYVLQVQANCLISAQQAQLKSPAEQTQPANCQAVEYLEPLEFDQDPIPTSPQAEAIVFNPQNGQIMAFAADPLQGLQPGYLPAHPGGSLSTPFIYLTAFTRGLSPASLVWDTPFETDPIVRNPDNLYHGPLRLRIAMANDYLVAAQKTLEQVGIQNVLQITRQFGITPLASNNTTSVNSENLLGKVDILQIGRAFGIFANQGLLAGKENPRSVSMHPEDSIAISPVTILRISQSDQSVIYQAEASKSRPVISPQLAYLVNHILSDEAARWASLGHPNPLETGYPLAAKLSQTLDGNSNWVIGYSTERVVGVWLGNDDSLDQAGDQPNPGLSNAAAGLWHALATYTMQISPGASAFPVPDGISSLSVCDPSGMLPDHDCPNTVTEIFLPGNEPVQADTLFHTIPVNRQTGHLATVFTPVDLVEERVYMMVPTEEYTWIEQSGIPIPPQTHDIVPSDPPSSPEVQLLSPDMFNTVTNEVTITGIVSLSEVDFFRVQIGQGLNPQSWLQVGEDFSQSNEGSFRVVWDTTGLDGVYTIQLIAVRQDQSIQRDAILVTIDNLAPKITIQQPYPGEILSAPKNKEFIFQADVKDNLGIQKVEFYLDGKILASRFVSPFIATWRPVFGEHTLKIIAIDQAGNQTSTETTFTLQ